MQCMLYNSIDKEPTPVTRLEFLILSLTLRTVSHPNSSPNCSRAYPTTYTRVHSTETHHHTPLSLYRPFPLKLSTPPPINLRTLTSAPWHRTLPMPRKPFLRMPPTTGMPTAPTNTHEPLHRLPVPQRPRHCAFGMRVRHAKPFHA